MGEHYFRWISFKYTLFVILSLLFYIFFPVQFLNFKSYVLYIILLLSRLVMHIILFVTLKAQIIYVNYIFLINFDPFTLNVISHSIYQHKEYLKSSTTFGYLGSLKQPGNHFEQEQQHLHIWNRMNMLSSE